MANVVKLKRSAVQNKVPQTSDLELGELAVNTYDGAIYFKKDPGTESIVKVSVDGHAHTISDVTGLQAYIENLIYRGATPPPSPSRGSLWVDTTSLNIYIWDDTQTAWIEK